MRVEVYKHWPKSRKYGFAVYAVRDITKGSPDYGRVISHTTGIELTNATFSVQPAGNKKVRETGVKNVHAFIRGDWDDSIMHDIWRDYTNPRTVRYNPKTMTRFMALGETIHKADLVVLSTVVGAWDKRRKA